MRLHFYTLECSKSKSKPSLFFLQLLKSFKVVFELSFECIFFLSLNHPNSSLGILIVKWGIVAQFLPVLVKLVINIHFYNVNLAQNHKTVITF